jgi:Outer membrane protein (porin)
MNNSRWGMKGSEDLGKNLTAIFQLENGFDPQTGRMDNSGRLFGRYAYVGLQSELGTLQLGRQPSEGFYFFGYLDPLTVGNYTANQWPYFLTQGWFDNVARYYVSIGNLEIGGSYGFGQQPGQFSANSSWGIHSKYTVSGLTIGAVYQNARNAQARPQQMWGLAATYVVGAATLSLGYIGGEDKSGVVDSFLNDPSKNVTPGSFSKAPRKDAIGYTGISYQFSPAISATGAFYYDKAKDVNGYNGNSGTRYTAVLLVDYSLSKSTTLYGTVDFNKVSGGNDAELPGKNNQTGVAIGLQHRF